MELSTHNGGVTVAMPSHFSARIQAETGMGRIQSDFPLPANADVTGLQSGPVLSMICPCFQ
jgi:hypothetical protein